MMKIKEQYIRWSMIPVVGFIMTLIVKHEAPDPFWYNWLVSCVFTAVFWNGAVIIISFFRNKLPSIRVTPLRITITMAVYLVFLIVVGTILRLTFGYLQFSDLSNFALVFDHFFANLIVSFIVGSLYETVYFFGQWKKMIQLNESLKNQQIRTQFEVLQNQMSPHFLFNSLNTLTTLIAENQDVAIEFTQKMSEVYRYILQNKDKELVSIEEEIEFARAYLFLLKMRYPQNLKANFRIDPEYNNKYIAPLTIQMLIENAIKHNVISKAHPLFIDVYVDNGYSIVVKNNLQEKKVIEKSTKTGLENIKKRYQYLGNKSIDIITTQKNFMVAIPLINLIHERDNVMAG